MISKERLRKIIYNNTIFDTATDLNTHYDKHNASIQKDVDRAISSGKMAKAEVSPIGLTMSDTADENIENVPDNITLKYTDGTEYVIDGEDAYNTIVSLKDSGKSWYFQQVSSILQKLYNNAKIQRSIYRRLNTCCYKVTINQLLDI